MQGDFAWIPKSMSTSPHNFQQPLVAGATSGGYQSNQAGYSKTSLSEHVQPQRPQVLMKASKPGPYDGQRQLMPVTQRQREDPKPANRGAQMSDWYHHCRVLCGENNRLDIEVSKMEQENQDLTLKLKQAQDSNDLLVKQISKYEQQHAQEIHRSGSYLDDSKAATPALLVSALNGVKDASNNFAKVFKAQVDSSPSTIQAYVKHLLSQDVGQVSRIGHIKFQYQAFVCQRLFEGFSHRNFGLFESTPGLPVTTVEHCFRQYQMHDFKKSDPVERLFQRHPEIDNFLNEYCFRKFSLIFNRQLEEQLFDGKHEHNDSIDKHEHPCNSRFYRSYCKLAVSIWLVHRLGFSFNPPAKLFRPLPGMPFNTSNMQSVVPLDSASDDEEVQLRVGFCIIPGMKVGESIVPSEVYVFGQ
jgi:structural maintenance of chromosome 1